MSRVGKKPILIPDGVEIKIEGQKVAVKGPKGELSLEVSPEVKIENRDNKILVLPAERKTKEKKSSAFWGLTRALIFNAIKGVKEGYERKLELEGIGYRASVDGKNLELKVGFSHPVKIEAPEDINFKVEKNIIMVSGPDKQKVGEIAAKIRKVKPAEPYKGKGIKYVGEVIRRKAGKKAVATTL
ncbi:MAG: 50S ribosomal protein L6 [Parcubacteria group bacterium CG11_big_fil_rev_8_21_14_0_20_39_14]|nr:MAG: 50S ribosomal protein L6 [Parcubacteria group bacterium CG11_big_fil_rev_8_21_14_0_20_39_14]PIS35236.1 MAG: 50S ribosomal protein L6 [Parcubacteria group bacterium CG08_land_8_20_14_0_20_38_56]